MRAFWLGLGLAAMAAAAWASDEPKTEVGDWVMMKTTMMMAGVPVPGMPPMTTLTRVEAIEDGLATLGVWTLARIPGKDQPDVTFAEVKDIPLDWVGYDNRYRYAANMTRYSGYRIRYLGAGWDDAEVVGVLENENRTFEMDGVTFAGVTYVKMEIVATSSSEDGDRPEFEGVFEAWHDAKAPFAMAQMLQRVTEGRTRTPEGWVKVVETTVRVAYGRADDPIPEDDGEIH